MEVGLVRIMLNTMLTPKQYKLYKFLKVYAKKNNVMPTFEEMKTYMNRKSKSAIFQLLFYMEWKGYIKRHPAHARAIEIIKEYENE
jgi:repressor LexA